MTSELVTSEDGARFHEWRWGPARIFPMAEVPNRGLVIGIETEYDRIHVYVSPAGKAVRVYRDDKELT